MIAKIVFPVKFGERKIKLPRNPATVIMDNTVFSSLFACIFFMPLFTPSDNILNCFSDKFCLYLLAEVASSSGSINSKRSGKFSLPLKL